MDQYLTMAADLFDPELIACINRINANNVSSQEEEREGSHHH
jgi:hypothetical protein